MSRKPAPKKPAAKKPTEAEFNILGVIWELESATVREVHDALKGTQDIGYTTVLKLMQIMTEKGLLERDTGVRPQVYWAARPRGQTQKALLRDLVDRAFSGSSSALVLQALSMRKSSPEELDEIRALLDALEEKDR
ncbi:MAG: BlaI/MecI/CopY family transcriptional regulator [Planctomycetota bacterium]